jgi:hypothetical protein
MNKKTQLKSNYFNYFCFMKRVLLLFILSIVLIKSNAQINWLKPNTGYYEYNGLKADSVMVPALDTLSKAPNGAIAIKSGIFYIKNSGVWVKGSGGNTIYTADDTIASNRVVYGNKKQITFKNFNTFNTYINKTYTWNIYDSSTEWNVLSVQPNGGSANQFSWNNQFLKYPYTNYSAFIISSSASDNNIYFYDTAHNGSINYAASLSHGFTDTFSSRRYVRSLGYITSVNAGYGLTGSGTSGSPVKVDSTTILPLSTITLNTSGSIHTTPINFTRVGGAWSGSMSLATQSPYTVFGRGSGSGTPSFLTLDSNYFAGGWRKAVSGAMLGYSNTWTGLNIFNNTVTASANLAQGTVISPTLNAAAANDVLIGLDIYPTFNANSFSGVTNYPIRWWKYNTGYNIKSDGIDISAFNGSGSSQMDIQRYSTSGLRLCVSGGNILAGYGGDDGVNKLQVNGSSKATQYRLSALNTAPSSSSDVGTTGEIRVTATYIYICTATNTWVRTALSTF